MNKTTKTFGYKIQKINRDSLLKNILLLKPCCTNHEDLPAGFKMSFLSTVSGSYLRRD
jgi:hypothetical protein